MQIRKIRNIRNYRIFSSFDWPGSDLKFLSRNLVYGLNGSGKSTLASLLYEISQNKVDRTTDYIFEMEDGSTLNKANSSILQGRLSVFSKDFVDSNVAVFDKVVYIGSDKTDAQNKLTKIKRIIEGLKSMLHEGLREKESYIKELNNMATDKAREIKKEFVSIGGAKYVNYNSISINSDCDRFGGMLLTLPSESSIYSGLSSLDKISKIEYTHFLPKSIDLNELHDNILKSLMTKPSSILIDFLTQNPELSSWVGHGLALHTNHSYSRCMFCENDISPERIKALESHFNDSYYFLESLVLKTIEEISTAISQIDKIYINLSSLNIINNMTIDCQNELQEFKVYKNHIINALEDYRKQLVLKKDNLMAEIKFRLDFNYNFDFSNIIACFNNHNIQVDNIETNRASQIEELLKIKIAPYYHVREELRPKISKIESDILTWGSRLNYFEQEKQRLVNLLNDSLTPAEELTEELSKFLGRSEFTFEIIENGYRLSRNGKDVNRLSEGERTAVSLLHFLKKLKDVSLDRTKQIVVIDDPVSSLDSNSMYSAFNYIVTETKNVCQLFIFTHNFNFARSMFKWINNPNTCFLLTRKSTINTGTPELKSYNGIYVSNLSEYHYLFGFIYRLEASVGEEDYFMIANVIRRLLESFLMFKYPSNNPLNQLHNNSLYPNKELVFRFVNDFSHFAFIPTDESATFSEGHDLLKVVSCALEWIKFEDAVHYQGMVDSLR